MGRLRFIQTARNTQQRPVQCDVETHSGCGTDNNNVKSHSPLLPNSVARYDAFYVKIAPENSVSVTLQPH